MKYKIDDPIQNLIDGAPLKDGERTWTARRAISLALIAEPNGPMPLDKKLKQFSLLTKVVGTPADGELDLAVDEAAAIRETLWVLPTLLAGHIATLLDRKAE